MALLFVFVELTAYK